MIASAIVIHLVTDSDTLVIESEYEDVQVHVTKPSRDNHEGTEVRNVEWITGSDIVRLRSGHYRLFVMNKLGEGIPAINPDYVLSKEQFVLNRGGKVIVKVIRKKERVQDDDAGSAPVASYEIPPIVEQVFASKTASATAVPYNAWKSSVEGRSVFDFRSQTFVP